MSASKRMKRRDDEDSEDVYVVEAVINKRRVGSKNEYLLKWQGFPLEEATWEPEENIACSELIAVYENKILEKKPEPAEVKEEKDVDQIIGATKSTGEIHFLIRFKDRTAALVSAKEANTKYTQHVIQFYERNLRIQ